MDIIDSNSHVRAARLLAVSFALFLLGGCSGGGGGDDGGGTTPQGDTTAPTVTSVSPANSAIDVPLDTKISATFSEALTAASVSTSTFTVATTSGGSAVAGTVSLSGNTATFTPNANLASNTGYTAKLTTGIQDAAGNPLAATYAWTFTTVAVDNTPPSVTSNFPANTATDVVLNTSVSATFSEAMNVATINTASFTLATGGAPVSGSVALSGTTATFAPDALLAANTGYVATITTAATDLAGNPLAANYSWSFTTGAVSDNQPPTVASTVPADGATGVAQNVALSVKFSEAMKASTINDSTFTLSVSGGAAVTGTVGAAGDTATFTPSAALAENMSYIATLTTGIQDAAGNPLAVAYNWTFKTLDATAPTITFVSPPDLSIGRSINSPISAIFSEAMDDATLTSSTFQLSVTGGAAVAGTVSYDAANQKAIFDPTNALAGDTSYTATITTAVTDASGIPLAAGKTWTFTTQMPTIRHFTSKAPSSTTTLGTLVAVDPYTLAKTTISDVLVERGAAGNGEGLISYIESAEFDDANNDLRNQRRFAVVYATTNGGATATIVSKTVEQATQGAAVTTTTFSNITGITTGNGDGLAGSAATDLCYINIANDYASVNDALIIVQQAGPDKECDSAANDDTSQVVRYGDGAAAVPGSLPAGYVPVSLIYDFRDGIGDGGIYGVLAISPADNNTLYRLSGTDYATATKVTNTPTAITGVQLLGYFESGNMLLRINNTIRSYNVGTNTLNAISATLADADWLDRYTFASPTLFFVDSTTGGNATKIQKLTYSGGTPALYPSFYMGSSTILSLENTPDRVIFQEGANVRSIAKSDATGTATTIISNATLIGVASQTGLVPRVYANLNNLGTWTAKMAGDDGSDPGSIANSRWVAGTTSSTLSFGNTRSNGRNIVLLTRAASAVNDAGATLVNYEAPTSIVGEILGTLPAGISEFVTFPGVLSGSGLVYPERGGAPLLLQARNLNTTTDIYYIDPFVANSLNDLGTNVNGLNDSPVFFLGFNPK